MNKCSLFFIYFFFIRTRAQELCESRSGRPGLPVRNSPWYGLSGRKATWEEVHTSCPTTLSKELSWTMGWTSLPVFVCDASGEIVKHESVKEFSTTPLNSVSQGQAWQRPCIDNTACAKVVSAMTELQSWLAQLLGTAVTSGNTGGECLQHKRTKQRKHRLVGRQGKASLRLRCNRLLFVGRCLHSPHLQQDYTSSFVIFEPALNRLKN